MTIITWRDLVAIMPSADAVASAAQTLAEAYNDSRNAALLGHTAELSTDDVVAHYASLQPPHGYGFFLLANGTLAGDGDLRGVANGDAEFAFLIAAPSAQGKGLGTRFAMMVHAFAVRELGLQRVYATVIPTNVASQRVFEKLGYVRDHGTRYRDGDDGDIVLRVDLDRFVEQHATALAEIVIARS